MVVTRQRGPLAFGPWRGYLTVHPCYLLRLPDEESRHAAYAAFVADLRAAHDLARG